MKRFLITSLILIPVFMFILSRMQTSVINPKPARWSFESIDTMKYSRDLSREKKDDPLFDTVINQQVSLIAKTGATHVAIATPYDDEFYPILPRWVHAARRNHLSVWFRGNFSGWEGWFGYPKISREQHVQKTEQFIKDHPDLFADGDIFTACPECENGGPGDPRVTGDIYGHRQFLIQEYQMTTQAFAAIHKRIASNYDSMNADVAKLIMDKKTTKALGGVVVIDHYVKEPKKLIADVTNIAETSGGHVVLGEFGAPIPDINGDMTEHEQALWLQTTLELLTQTPSFVGGNYWVSFGGSSQLWEKNGTPREAVKVLTNFYTSQRPRSKS